MSNVQRRKVDPKAEMNISGDALLAFISGAQTNIGRSTFYNLPDEQRQALADMHSIVSDKCRPFYTLMVLPVGVNDVNKQMIAWNLIIKTLRESDLKSHQNSPTTMWENEVILQAFDNMQPNRVLDFMVMLADKKISKKRAVFLFHEWLRRHKGSWGLWAIKYRKDFKKVLRHFHAKKDDNILSIWRYLAYNELKNRTDKLIKTYEDVRNGDISKLTALPATIAEGFIQKFNLTKESFWDKFTKEGGKLTAKEKRLKANSVEAAGSSTNLDVRKLGLFEYLVYLNSTDTHQESVRHLLDEKAKAIAGNIPITLEKVGLILDSSLSMYGSKDQPNHPLLRGVAISYIVKHISVGYKEYRSDNGTSVIPKLGGQSNYAEQVIQALKDGCKTIVIVGDGYENAPFEGATHQVIYTVKKKLDKDNEITFLHFNPVFASESMDVRSISELASPIGIREVKAFNESLFLAIAKQRPELALKGYMGYLAGLQNEKAKSLMPSSVKKLVGERTELTFQV